MSFVNVRRILLRHKRGAKCPLLEKFVRSCFKERKNSFLPISDIYLEYRHALSLWTDGDSDDGQTKMLLKEKAFQRVSY